MLLLKFKKSANVRSEQSPEEVLQILVKLQDNVIEDGSSSIFTKPMKCVPMGMEIWSKSKVANILFYSVELFLADSK